MQFKPQSCQPAHLSTFLPACPLHLSSNAPFHLPAYPCPNLCTCDPSHPSCCTSAPEASNLLVYFTYPLTKSSNQGALRMKTSYPTINQPTCLPDCLQVPAHRATYTVQLPFLPRCILIRCTQTRILTYLRASLIITSVVLNTFAPDHQRLGCL